RLRAAAARVPGVLRLDSRRHRGRLRGAVLVLHRVHGGLGRDDPRARRRPVSGVDPRRVSRKVCPRAAHGLGVARPAAAARAFAECVTIVGGVLIILGVAQGLTSYLVGAQVPSKLIDWAQGNIRSRLAFLLVLNLFLLAVGWLMEIWAALVVVVPIIVPLGA